MIVSSFIAFVARLIDSVEFVAQSRTICNQEAQWAYAVAGVQISGQANTNRKEACLFSIPILPTLTKFRGNRWGTGIAPFKFQGDIRCTALMAERSRRVSASEDIVLNVSLASTKGVESIRAQITIEGEWKGSSQHG